MIRRSHGALIAGFALCAMASAVHAQTSSGATVPPAFNTSMPGVAPVSGRVNVMAVLADLPLAEAMARARSADAPRKSVPWSADQQRAYSANLLAKQAAIVSGARSLGADVHAQLTKASNAVLMSIDASQLSALQRVPGVTATLPVLDMETSDENTNAYVGATALRNRVPSIDGSGLRIAILDSGIDFTHRNLGGPGTVAAYAAAYGATACGVTAANTAPPAWTSKVIGGFDFVGESWPNTALQPDPNPIDCQGHGTSVADIAAGRSTDGAWLGMAPGAQLYAVKVCSAVATSCSGVAIVQGLEWSLDPNGDGDLSDAVDIVNMSLGANFGQRENSSAEASQVLTRFGVVVVASAGNGGNVPMINGSPSSAPEAIAVAQTQVAGQFGIPLNTSIGNFSNTQVQAWANPVVADITGPLIIDRTSLAAQGCTAYPAPIFAGGIALVRRGTCSISVKTGNATAAGALAVIIDNNAPGDAPPFSFGGGTAPFAPTLSITQGAGDTLRAATGAITATVSFSGRISLDGSMVASSSRGPNMGYAGIKPDIGAPGASIAATVGTGSGTATFGGTSGAAPVVAGAAALMLQAQPSLQTHELKARLMSSAMNNVFNNPLTLPGQLAPVTRIGAGELRVAAAVDSSTTLWDAANPNATSLSFGYQAVTSPRVLRKRVVVRNFANAARTYTIAPSFRYAADAASGGVSVTTPPSITVPANSSAAFTLQMTINPAGLPVWQTTGVNGGTNGMNGALLESVEYDGYVTLTSGSEVARLPWHVLPRRSHQGAAANVAMSGGAGTLSATNAGGSTAANADVFALTGTSAALPPSAFPGVGDNLIVGDLRAAGVRAVNLGAGASWEGSLGVQFAVSRFDSPSHPRPFRTIILIDSNRDGTDDWQVTVTNVSTTDFRMVGFVQRLSGCASAAACPSNSFFLADVDLQSSNMIITLPVRPRYPSFTGAAQTVIDPAVPFNFRVQMVDWYFTGATTDTIGTMTYSLSTPKFGLGAGSVTVPVNGAQAVPVTEVPGGAAASPSQSGVLLMWRDGQPGREASLVSVN